MMVSEAVVRVTTGWGPVPWQILAIGVAGGVVPLLVAIYSVKWLPGLRVRIFELRFKWETWRYLRYHR